MKTCSRCGGPSHNTKRQSLLCLPCKRAYDKQWRASRKAAGDPVISTPMPREYFEAYNAVYYARPEIKQHKAEYQRVYAKLPHVAPKVQARMELRNALRRGDVVRQSCELCGDNKTHGHHDDYSKPLQVRWLCRLHHEQEHYAKAEQP